MSTPNDRQEARVMLARFHSASSQLTTYLRKRETLGELLFEKRKTLGGDPEKLKVWLEKFCPTIPWDDAEMFIESYEDIHEKRNQET